MSDLDSELARVRDELAEARVQEIRLAARITGLEAERDALMTALSRPSAAPPGTLALASMTKDRAIVAVLEASPRPLKIGEIVDALHDAGRPAEQYNGVSVYLDTLLKQGRVQRPERGLYTARGHDTDGDDGRRATPAA